VVGEVIEKSRCRQALRRRANAFALAIEREILRFAPE
jgi:hypothetical protein